MISNARLEFKTKITELEASGDFLEAFLIQSAYIESLLRRLFGYQLSLNIQAAGIRKAIKGRNLHLNSVLKFSLDAGWLNKNENEKAKRYFEERNLIVHDLVASNSTSLESRLKKLLGEGKSIIEDHGSLEKFMSLAQQGYSRGELVATKEALDLSDQERKVFELRFSGKTLEEVGQEFGVTREWVRQIQNRAIQKMEGLVSASTMATEALAKLKVEARNGVAVKNALKKAAEAKQKAALLKSADLFIKDVSSRQNVPVSDLLGKSRKADLVLVRHWVAYILKEKFGLPYLTVGKILNRDHTTIIHAHNRIKSLIREGKLGESK